ncbi:MAG: bifunctional (p)ppGpp synthetase/guanosine-3',5'-bis(diphosphate) 3'-pyrophosphohydrolase, partial [Lachnospiraceae bacterium]|nr:bifunctional (p)ppGpp synthetase/guanosine-3',5'-bis(diphosphate) 3'-pyrophosphohydrolase [Lachnospiraceae bacterium]
MSGVSTVTSEDFEQLEERISKPNRSVVPTHDFEDPAVLYDELIDRVRRYHPNADITMIEKAYRIADDAHKEQKRKSGEPYIIHPLCVATILADLEMDKETIAAGLLHDVVEDTVMTRDEIVEEFSEEVAELVDGVTKLGQLPFDADKVEVQAENLRKMFLAMAKDIRVIIIKLADRLHNMRTLKYMRPEKQREKARETMEIYAPLAQRLGISRIKIELDDLALKYLEPEAYYDLVEKIASRKAERDQYVQRLTDEVRHHIENAQIKADIEGRAKHFFSIYKKMVNQHKTLDQIYDLFAIRIIVEDVKDCYAALEVIHELYTPIPGRFKDYIAMPKPNMYQSLHTTLIGPNGTPFEIQIRTFEMHRTSEYGIAAHWKYKESGEGATVNGEEAKLSWLRQILEWQQDMSDNREFVSLLKNDLNLFSDTVFCFTPSGDVKNLPTGSNPIDFAYSIHSAVGNKMVGAKVNGKLVPIDYKIQNGDRIEIITSQNSRGPSRDWLNMVASAQAKNKINQWFRSITKEENVSKGSELLIESAKSKGVDLGLINKPKYQERVIRRYGFHDWDAVLAAIGQASLKEGQVINRMQDAYRKDHPLTVTDADIIAAHASGDPDVDKDHTTDRDHHRKSRNGIIVKGLYDV